ncbi:MAG: hypothetical protein BIFFINMI_00089 [Phycisphaerae bacterium]|nr:hypothetical protein [Phycisphaerae bacterium]
MVRRGAMLLGAGLLLEWTGCVRADQTRAIDVGQAAANLKLPAWATWQMKDAAACNAFAEAFMARFVDAKTGKPVCEFNHGTADDVVEGVQTWDRFALACGSPATRAGMVRLLNYVYGWMVEHGDFKEGFYVKPYDAEHMGEFFQMLWACQEIAPADAKLADENRQLADAIIDRCYNAKTRLIKHPWLELSGGDFYKIRHIDRVNPDLDELTNGVFINSAFRAYMTTGDEKYRKWALEYGGKWNELAAANGGVFPFSADSATGLASKEWWKGSTKFDFQTWGLIVAGRWLHGWPVAMMYMDRGDAKHLAGVNSTLDVMFKSGVGGLPADFYDPAAGKWVRGKPSTWWVPKLVDRPYAMTFDKAAGQRIVDYYQAAKAGGKDAATEEHFLQWHMFTYFGAFDEEWAGIQFKNGVDHAQRRKAKVDACTEMPKSGDNLTDYAMHRPMEFGLIDGSFFGMYDNGRAGNPSTAVLGYWTDAKTPGLPPGVAALVRHVGPEGVTLLLCNTTDQPVTLHVIGGFYGTHRIDSVAEADRPTVPVGARTAAVRLAANGVAKLTLKMTRFAYRPTLLPLAGEAKAW